MKRTLTTRILPVLLSLALLLALVPVSAPRAAAATETPPKPETVAAKGQDKAVSKTGLPRPGHGTRGDGDWNFDELDVMDLVLDRELELSFADGQEELWLRFTPETLSLYRLVSFGDADVFVTLWDENGNQIGYDDDSGNGYNFDLSSLLSAERTYYFQIGRYSGSPSFSVQLTAEELDPIEIHPDQELSVDFAAGQPYVWLHFEAPASAVYTLDSFGACDPYAMLLDEELFQLAYNDDGGEDLNFSLQYYLEAGQSCYYRLGHYEDPDVPVKYTVLLTAYVSSTSGECGAEGDNLLWSFDTDTGVLTIEGSGDMMDYGYSEAPWMSYAGSIAELRLPEGMTSVGACAFCECSQLTEITVPDTVDRIGASAFCWCSALSSVTLPDHLTSLGYDAFRSCYELISLTLPEGLTAIEPFTFVGCSALTSVTIPEGVAVIGCSAFEYCSDLASVSLPESVTCIGEYAFAGCRGLSSVKLPAGIGRIETGAFENCPKLDMLVIRNADCLAGFMSENYSPDDTEEDMNDFSDETLGEHRTVIYGRHDQARLDSGDIAERYRYAEAYAVNYGYTFYDLYAFTDVREYSWYEIPVAWACGNGITAGTGEGLFSPGSTCTREQTVTFLWKAAGSPEPETTENPFRDVKPNKYYYKAVLWALENEITAGVDLDLFGVGRSCTREQVVTFLWKAAGSPEPLSEENPFRDVKANKYYYRAILWAVENGITAGVDVDLFGVGQNCTRAQIVTFLYKTDRLLNAGSEFSEWSVIGSICGSNWDVDFPMTETEENVFESEVLELHANEEFKVRLNGSWDTNYGVNGPDGDNYLVTEDGQYIVRFDLNYETLDLIAP